MYIKCNSPQTYKNVEVSPALPYKTIIWHTNRYLWYLLYNLTHEQIALVINNYFKFDTATGKLASQREQFCFCMYTYQNHLENLSYQTRAKLWALKSSWEGTFLTKQLSKTIVTCGTLRVNSLEVICGISMICTSASVLPEE